MTKTATVTTPVGTFSRATASEYTHINVWTSPFISKEKTVRSGVWARWAKDNGFGVTWHKTEEAARKASAKYGWEPNATLVGTFPVSSH